MSERSSLSQSKRRSLKATMAGLLGGAIAAVEADSGAVYLVDADQGDLVLKALSNRPEEAMGHRLAMGEGLVGKVAEEGRSLISPEIGLDPRAIRRRADWDTDIHSFLGLPLRTGDLVIGVLELTSERPEAFTPEQRGRAAILADAAALLIEQTRLASQPPPAALEDEGLSGEEPMGLLTLNARLLVTAANPTLCRLVGQPVEALVGRPAIAALPLLGRPRARDAMEAALRGTPGHLGQARGVDRDGAEQALSLTLIPLGDPARGVAGIVVVVVDLSARARLESELREQSRLALEARDRLRTVVEVVSHELRTPLTSVLGFARLLQDRPDEAPDRRSEWSAQVADKARLMARLVDEITDLARLGSASFVLRKEPAHLGPIVEQVAGEQGALSDSHRIELDLPERLPEIELDQDRIAQLLGNLLTNAIKFWPEGGTIRISARVRPAGVEDSAGRVLELSVADSGPGVPADQRERIFEPFQRGAEAKAKRIAGTGLGLAISRGIVEAHGGRIWLEPGPEGGSVFRFTLPVEAAER